MLEARRVTVRRGDRRALVDVSLCAAPGEVLALCGPNGAGKSTLLAVLAGDLAPASGAALIDGMPIGDLPPGDLALRRAVLEQSPGLSAPFRVGDLVALGLGLSPMAPDAAARIVDRALADVGLRGFADRPALRLSGGERARAHVARTLAQIAAGRLVGQGRYLLLDEPTAALDIAHQVGVMRAARRAAQAGAGVLVVLHDLNLAAAFADRAALLRDGRLDALGAPLQVFEARRLSAVYGSPITVTRSAKGGLRIAPDFDAALPAPEDARIPNDIDTKEIPCSSP